MGEWPQRQRDADSLHGLGNHCQHMLAQGIQVSLISQPGAEGFWRFGCVVLSLVEAAVYEGAYTTPPRIEEGSYLRLSPPACVYHRPVEVVRVEVLGENTAGSTHL